jgi:hypothetical protein
MAEKSDISLVKTLVSLLVLRNSKLLLTEPSSCFCNSIRIFIKVGTLRGGLPMWLAGAWFGLPSVLSLVSSLWSPYNSTSVARMGSNEFRFGSSNCDRIRGWDPSSCSTTLSSPTNPDACITSPGGRLGLNFTPTV